MISVQGCVVIRIDATKKVTLQTFLNVCFYRKENVQNRVKYIPSKQMNTSEHTAFRAKSTSHLGEKKMYWENKSFNHIVS